MNIVFGGSFNPPTKAHYLIAKYILDNYPVENFIFLPTGINYNKKDLNLTKSRVDMLNIIKEKLGKKVVVSKMELENNSSYKGTLHSLNILNKEYKNIYFIMGADNLVQIETWINYEELIKNYKFIIINRDNINIMPVIEKYNIKDYIILDLKLDISSSNYRKTKNKDLILEDVLKYIDENKLY